jgi:hypothetical protein
MPLWRDPLGWLFPDPGADRLRRLLDSPAGPAARRRARRTRQPPIRLRSAAPASERVYRVECGLEDRVVLVTVRLVDFAFVRAIITLLVRCITELQVARRPLLRAFAPHAGDPLIIGRASGRAPRPTTAFPD